MGYKDKINPKSIIDSQIINHLNEIDRIGESRHKAKIVGEASPYIFSIKTYENYKETMFLFADYCIKNHHTTSIWQCKQYVEEYINQMIEDDYSSYTQKSRLSGFRKFYSDPFEEIKTESRKRSQIKRGRQDTSNARHFDEKANTELIWFCQHTGLRRSELEHLKGQCVSKHDDGNFYIDGVKGKGGRVRNIMIIDNDRTVIDKINSTSSDDLVWGKVHSHANIHGYRADYCQCLYNRIARNVDGLNNNDKYICRNDMAGLILDKKAMKFCSEQLGHSRIGIIAYNYLYGLKK